VNRLKVLCFSVTYIVTTAIKYLFVTLFIYVKCTTSKTFQIRDADLNQHRYYFDLWKTKDKSPDIASDI
jgi:hypothetical protein